MDLFNPPPDFNYTKMSKDLDFTKFDNPYVQVVWEDFAENFTQEKLKSVKHYFQKKYKTNNVNVITKTKITEEVAQNVDISFNVLDKNYQIELIKSFLDSKSSINKIDEILNLDKLVEYLKLTKLYE